MGDTGTTGTCTIKAGHEDFGFDFRGEGTYSPEQL
jgi:hypothetical protein